MVDASLQVARPCEMPRSARYHRDRELVPSILEVFLVDVTVNDRHDPLFATHAPIEVPHQEVVPHHLAIPGLELLQLWHSSLTTRLGSTTAWTWIHIFYELVGLSVILRS